MPSITSALQASLSGLKATQAGIDVVSQNVANAGSAGYTRKTQTTTPLLANGEVVGVQAGTVGRALDTLLQRQVWTESAGGSYTSNLSGYAQNLVTLFGEPGGDGALDTVFNDFTTAVQTLTSTPGDQAAQGTALNKAKMLANQLNSVSDGVQTLRSNAEQQISGAVDKANAALSSIENISNQLLQQGSTLSAALLDQRDSAISSLSSLMDVKVVRAENSKISIFTSGGAMLFDGKAATLAFDSHAPLSAASHYSTDPATRTVGTITLTASNGSTVDMVGSGLIRSGEIGALLDLRDTTLPQAQAQLDGIAASISQALSDQTVASTPVTGGAQVDLSTLQPGNTVSLTVQDGATTRKILLVKVANAGTDVSGATGGVAGVTAIPFTDAASAATALTGTGGPLATNFAASSTGSILTVAKATAGTGSVTSLSARSTVTGLASGSTSLPLFVDGGGSPYTGSFDNGAQSLGYAGRIQVNPAVLADSTALVKYGAGVGDSDATRSTFIANALTKAKTSIGPDTGLGGSANPFTGTVGDLVRQVVGQQGANASQAKALDSGQQVVVNALTDRMQKQSGVSIDTEMTSLIQLQNAYSANARVMSTLKDMMQLLMNM